MFETPLITEFSVLIIIMCIGRSSEDFLYSKKSITQDDSLSMFLYAIGILTLIKSLKSFFWKMIWYADDAHCCGSLARA